MHFDFNWCWSLRRKEPPFGNEFRKPVWYDEESDDELFDNNKIFGYQVFTNPLEIEKYYEAQMQEMLKSLNEFEGTFKSRPTRVKWILVIFFLFLFNSIAEHKSLFDENIREDYMKPGFENAIEKELKQKKKQLDTDLDGEIYADQLHSLLQRITPEAHTMIALDAFNKSRRAEKENNIAAPPATAARKLTDEEKIWNQIHGNANDENANNNTKAPIRRNSAQRIPHNKGAFEGVVGGPKTFRQGFTFEMIRKPGLSETRRTVVDEGGNTKTVIRRTIDGKTETITTYNGEAIGNEPIKKSMIAGADAAPLPRIGGNATLDCGRNLFVTKDGYVLPKNLWWLQVSQLSRIIFIFIVVVVVTFMCLSNNIINSKNRKSITNQHNVIITTLISWKIFFLKFNFEFDYGYDFR